MVAAVTPPDGPEPARRLARCSTWHFTGRAAGLLREMADWIDAHPTDLVLGLTLNLDRDGNGMDEMTGYLTVEDTIP